MMVASTIITDDRSTEELQKRFGELLDENVVLKETLKQNNDSMKEQFMLIASCQEDMLKTHRLHKEKFDETRELVERVGSVFFFGFTLDPAFVRFGRDFRPVVPNQWTADH